MSGAYTLHSQIAPMLIFWFVGFTVEQIDTILKGSTDVLMEHCVQPKFYFFFVFANELITCTFLCLLFFLFIYFY